MFINEIISKNFRNYKELYINFNQNKINILMADNGMGKSNLLDIIFYLSYGRSFRNISDKDLIYNNSNFFSISSNYIKNDIHYNLKVNFEKVKEVYLNNKKFQKVSDILGNIISVLFCNEDIFIVNGEPSIRRKYIDMFISIFDKDYLNNLKKYYYYLKLKNFILKNKQYELLDIYNSQIINSLIFIQNKRNEIIKEISVLFNSLYNKIGDYNEDVKIEYIPSIKSNDYNNILNIFKNNFEKEKNYGFSLLGPHKDNILFLNRNNNLISKYASFGQIRLVSLVIKLIQAEFYKKQLNFSPILLIDDVILELDKKRQISFIEYLKNFNQLFITINDKKYIDLFNNYNNINIIEIENGRIK